MKKQKENYHTHTYRCKHATGDVDDFCLEAKKEKFSVIGFSDHTPLPDDRWKWVRMDFSELKGYCKALDNAREKFPDLLILKGLECEYAEDLVPFYKEILREYKLNFFACGIHWFEHNDQWLSAFSEISDITHLRSYTKCLVQAIRSGLFTYIAHPDVFASSYRQWDEESEACSREIIETALENNVPFEINTLGFRKSDRNYPFLPFWKLVAEYKTGVLVNSDAHHPKELGEKYEKGEQLIEEFNLPLIQYKDLNWKNF